MHSTVEPQKKGFFPFPFHLKLKQLNIINEEDEIKKELLNVKREIDLAYHKFENATEKELIDSCIYEMKALQTKYEYYLKKAKEADETFSKDWEESS